MNNFWICCLAGLGGGSLVACIIVVAASMRSSQISRRRDE